MFTESVRVGCISLACLSGLAKNQTCLIFHQPSPTLGPDHGSADLETDLFYSHPSCPLTSSLVHITSSLVLITSSLVLS